MLHAYAARFDATKNLKKFLIFRCTKQDLSLGTGHGEEAPHVQRLLLHYLQHPLTPHAATCSSLHQKKKNSGGKLSHLELLQGERKTSI